MLLSRLKKYLQKKIKLLCIIYKAMYHRADNYRNVDLNNILLIWETIILTMYCSSGQLTKTIKTTFY